MRFMSFTGVSNIPGLTIISDFVTPDQAAELIIFTDKQPWRDDLKRRVQHYGYRYDYQARRVTADLALGPLPEKLQNLAGHLYDLSIFPEIPDQVIINEYLPGQGIAAHIDCVPCFTETIASLSLLSACTMKFQQPKTGNTIEIRLEPNSLAVLKDEARYLWTHSIPARKSDVVDGIKIFRNRRLSMTFRNVRL